MKGANISAQKVGRRSRQCDPDLIDKRQVRASLDEPTAGSIPPNPEQVNPAATGATCQGRIDEICGICLPTHDERVEVFRGHLRLKNRDPEAFGLDDLAGASGGYAAASIKEPATLSAFLAPAVRKGRIAGNPLENAPTERALVDGLRAFGVTA